jgi:hypothetical protein
LQLYIAIVQRTQKGYHHKRASRTHDVVYGMPVLRVVCECMYKQPQQTTLIAMLIVSAFATNLAVCLQSRGLLLDGWNRTKFQYIDLAHAGTVAVRCMFIYTCS